MILIKIDIKAIRWPLFIFIILIVISLTIPFLLPATFKGAYLIWIILAVVVILYGILIIGDVQ